MRHPFTFYLGIITGFAGWLNGGNMGDGFVRANSEMIVVTGALTIIAVLWTCRIPNIIQIKKIRKERRIKKRLQKRSIKKMIQIKKKFPKLSIPKMVQIKRRKVSLLNSKMYVFVILVQNMM